MGHSLKDRVLVTYATKYGATGEIAGKIADVLRDQGLEIDMIPAGEVNDLSPYRAAVIGSAVYMGRWRKDAVKLLMNNEKEFSGIAVWLFSSGPTERGDPVKLTDGWVIPGKVRRVAERISARGIELLHGAIDLDNLNFIEKWIIKKVGAPAGDYRDWSAIESWSVEIADQVKEIQKEK